MKYLYAIVLCLALGNAVHAGSRDSWPNKDKGYEAPSVGYYPPASTKGETITCGAYIRSTGLDRRGFDLWVGGFITGLNHSLSHGGNVLGSVRSAAISDFLILTEQYCKANPLGLFINGVTVPLGSIRPVDWQGNPY